MYDHISTLVNRDTFVLNIYQSSASLAFVRGIRRWPVNSPHKRPVTRKMFPFDDVIMIALIIKYDKQATGLDA